MYVCPYTIQFTCRDCISLKQLLEICILLLTYICMVTAFIQPLPDLNHTFTHMDVNILLLMETAIFEISFWNLAVVQVFVTITSIVPNKYKPRCYAELLIVQNMFSIPDLISCARVDREIGTSLAPSPLQTFILQPCHVFLHSCKTQPRSGLGMRLGYFMQEWQSDGPVLSVEVVLKVASLRDLLILKVCLWTVVIVMCCKSYHCCTIYGG